jgi:DNA (cytosine-5)-methyltransferase 1
MKYISLFSGVEAATVAWKPLGWEPLRFAEIEPFPSAVLKHHYPKIENVGDVMKHEWKQYEEKADLIVGGSPCQSFSKAGQRLGLDDHRGNLALKFLQIVRDVKPKWFVYENVHGLLSSKGGKDFATFLGEVAKCGYGFAYRVLDAQYFGVPQRRRRVFVVGCADGDWRSAAAVLFQPKSVQECASQGEQQGHSHSARTTDGVGETKPPIILDRASFNQGKNAQYKLHIKQEQQTPTLVARGPHAVFHQGVVRRFSPIEYERLQGFPDDYTKIEWRGKSKDKCPQGHRIKCMGNSMAVPVMRWIGERIQAVDSILKTHPRNQAVQHTQMRLW